MKKFAVFLLFVLPTVLIASPEVDTHKRVANPSVSVSNEEGAILGSGTLFVSKNKVYVLTCGHLFPEMRVVEKVKVDNKDGTTKEVDKVVWKSPKVSRVRFDKKGKEIGDSRSLCKMLLYSPAEEGGGIDLALLEVMDNDFAKEGAKFLKDDSLIKPSTEIVHVGALYGIPGCLVKGHFSRLDYNFKGRPFNLAIINGRPGSSGGGVFTIENGSYVYCGMTVRGDSGGLMMLKTPGMIRGWLKDNKMSHVIEEAQ